MSLSVSRSTKSRIALVTPSFAKLRWIKWLFVFKQALMNRSEPRGQSLKLATSSTTYNASMSSPWHRSGGRLSAPGGLTGCRTARGGRESQCSTTASRSTCSAKMNVHCSTLEDLGGISADLVRRRTFLILQIRQLAQRRQQLSGTLVIKVLCKRVDHGQLFGASKGLLSPR